MSIRILDNNGNTHQLSARLIADFESELRRIGEAPFPPTVNLWVSNQTPEELLEIQKRMPHHPVDKSGRNGAKVLDRWTPVVESSNKGSAEAIATTKQDDGPGAGYQVEEPRAGGQGVALPYRPKYPAGSGLVWESGRAFNSVYQRETGHIIADPGGLGERVERDGRYVNLREEQEESRNG